MTLKAQGFTLIELAVAIFLMGLLLLITTPKLGNTLFSTDLKSVARSLKATVHFLRSKSIVTHKNTILHLDLDKGVYWGSYDNPAAPLIRPRRLPEGIRFMDASNINTPKKGLGLLRTTFNPKGVLEETVLHLADKNENVLTVVINAYTGKFLLYDEYVDVEYGGDE